MAACAPRAGVRTGLDVLQETGFEPLRGKRVGLITNQTGRDRQGRGAVEVLGRSSAIRLEKIFSPEHGFTGVSEENVVSSDTVRLEGRDIPVVSLYSGGIAGMRPKAADLKNLDALVFDIQDIGARFYTYLASMGMALEEAAKAGIPFLVLDRPNPINGETMEGPVLEDLTLRAVTATAYFPIPVRHGMTAGEIALLHNAEVKHPGLRVVTLRGWSRGQWYDQTGLPWTKPSPNMPDLDAATLYPGVAIFETVNVSVGRGTPRPFRWIGAPWMRAEEVAARLTAARLPGVAVSTESFTPSKSVFAGQPCRGVRLTITDRERLRPLEVFVHLAAALRELNPEIQWRWDETRRMTGTDRFRELYESGGDAAEIIRLFDGGPRAFRRARKPYLLY